MRELSVVEQRYQAVLAVISDGVTVTDVAARFRCVDRRSAGTPVLAGPPEAQRVVLQSGVNPTNVPQAS